MNDIVSRLTDDWLQSLPPSTEIWRLDSGGYYAGKVEWEIQVSAATWIPERRGWVCNEMGAAVLDEDGNETGEVEEADATFIGTAGELLEDT